MAERRVAVIIEDDLDIRYLIETVLTQAGFETITTGNGEDGVAAVETYDPIVTTLDLSLPGIDGFETARRIRRLSSTYLVMVTARDDEVDTLLGLDAGADDYVTKPFRPRELRSRIEAMLRRPRAAMPHGPQDSPPAAVTAPTGAAVAPPAAGAPAAGAPPLAAAPPPASAPPEAAPDASSEQENWLDHAGLRLEPDARLVEVDGRHVDLTRSEFDLLQTVMQSRLRVRSKSDLALMLRGESYVTTHYVSDADRRAVEVHMANLRRKIGDNTAQPRFIVTVRGVGYRLTSADEARGR